MQIPEEIRKCVAFAGVRTDNGLQLGGTIFFVSVPVEGLEPGAGYIYAVTAKHVIDRARSVSVDGQLMVRVNTKDGPAVNLESYISDWKMHPDEDSVDVAVLQVDLPLSIFDIRYVPMAMAVTDQNIEQEVIGVGDDVFLTGLFVNHYGN